MQAAVWQEILRRCQGKVNGILRLDSLGSLSRRWLLGGKGVGRGMCTALSPKADEDDSAL